MRKKPVFKANIEAVRGSGCRAVYVHHSGAMHKLEFSFVTDDGEKYTVTMNHDVARDFLNSGISAYQAIMQPLQIARDVPFGG